MKPNEEVKALSKKFGIQVKRMEMIQNGVYKVITPRGNEYCLKRMAYTPARLRWIDKTLRRIRRRGFTKIVWRHPKRYTGKHLFVKWFHNSPPFVLHPWLEGSWPSPRSSIQMENCGMLLAKFHQIGDKIMLPKVGMNNQIGKWASYLLREQKVLQKAVHKARRNHYGNRLDPLLQAFGNEILLMAQNCLQSLRNSDYETTCRKTKATLCHGDCGPTNVIRSKRGMYLIDFETLRIDLRAYDLYRLIYNTCQDNGWDFGIMKSILDGYQKVCKLTSADYQMLKIWLRFPRGICKLLVHYDQKPLKEKLEIERDFLKRLVDERKREAVLMRLDNYANMRLNRAVR